jgi:predicted transcriptional regulator of viral defense system
MNLMDSSAAVLYPAGIGPRYRAYLERLHRDASVAFDVSEAARILDLDSDETARLLGYLSRRGWLSRVRRGLYVAVPLDARRSGEWFEDPWIVANRVYAPCYIGGWSACEHWDLTEQLFRAILVVTGRTIRRSDVHFAGMNLHVTSRSPEMIFGTVGIWRDTTRVEVSDPSRTIVDILDDPHLGGGLRHSADVLHEYLISENRDDARLIEYSERLGNRTIFKRLGYLLESREKPARLDVDSLIIACLERRSSGLTSLDPANSSRGRIVRRWNLRVNVDLARVDEK